jgi:hypothetical protein
MKDFQTAQELTVMREFDLYLTTYGYRRSLALAEALHFQAECYQRYLERQPKEKGGK